MNVRMSSGGQVEHVASSNQAEFSARGTLDCDFLGRLCSDRIEARISSFFCEDI